MDFSTHNIHYTSHSCSSPRASWDCHNRTAVIDALAVIVSSSLHMKKLNTPMHASSALAMICLRSGDHRTPV